MAGMSGTSRQPSVEEHSLEEELEEETVWMDEVDGQNFVERAHNDELAAHETVSAEEYHEVGVEYEEPNDSRFRLNLPNILSKKVQLDNGSILTLCFSKRGMQQIAVDGFLYNLSHAEGESTRWTCVTSECNACILSTSDLADVVRDEDLHSELCEPDELQLSLRIGIYDLRLMAEFTVVNLAVLYNNFVSTFTLDHPELTAIFPSYELLLPSMRIHRQHKLFRRRFELREGEVDKLAHIEIDDEQMMMNACAVAAMHEEVVEESYTARVPIDDELARTTMPARPHLLPYGKCREFPATYCFDCGVEISPQQQQQLQLPAFTAQHALIQHVSRLHQQTRSSSFIFEPAAFEMWLREAQRCRALRLRRFTLIGDDMYYLCGYDERLQRSKYSSRCHCTAYVKVNDYRNVSARLTRLVSMEFCLDHFGHEPEGDFVKSAERLLMDLKPEEFLLQMERRRQTTAHLIRSKQLIAVRRQSVSEALAMRAGIMRAHPNSHAWANDVFSTDRQLSRRAATKEISSAVMKAAAAAGRTPTVRPSLMKGTAPSAAGATAPSEDRKTEGKRLTKRENFKDQAIYEAVHQCEVLSDLIIRRLQHVKDISIAVHYHEVMSKLFARIQMDGECAPEWSARNIWLGKARTAAGKDGDEPDAKKSKEEGKEKKAVDKRQQQKAENGEKKKGEEKNANKNGALKEEEVEENERASNTTEEQAMAGATVPPESPAKTTLPPETPAKTTVPPETPAKTTLPPETSAQTTVPPDADPSTKISQRMPTSSAASTHQADSSAASPPPLEALLSPTRRSPRSQLPVVKAAAQVRRVEKEKTNAAVTTPQSVRRRKKEDIDAEKSRAVVNTRGKSVRIQMRKGAEKKHV